MLGQAKVAEKSNEITAIPELLKLLTLKGATVTIDAMGCQKEIAATIIEKEADYVLALKGNQGTLSADVELFFAEQKACNFKDTAISRHRTLEKSHGRIETRTYTATSDIAWLTKQHPGWKGLKSIVINAVWGLPKTVVDGSAASDLFIVSRSDPMEIKGREIPFKDQKYVCYPEEGVCRLEVTLEDGEKASLSDEEVKALARLGDQLEVYYGSPQDIEWALDPEGHAVILQCRPLSQTASREFPDLAGQDASGKKAMILEGGVTASPGVGSGPVFVVLRDMDALQFPKGAVLVADQSLPRWATLLNRASAVVTERPSIVCFSPFNSRHLLDTMPRGGRELLQINSIGTSRGIHLAPCNAAAAAPATVAAPLHHSQAAAMRCSSKGSARAET